MESGVATRCAAQSPLLIPLELNLGNANRSAQAGRRIVCGSVLLIDDLRVGRGAELADRVFRGSVTPLTPLPLGFQRDESLQTEVGANTQLSANDRARFPGCRLGA